MSPVMSCLLAVLAIFLANARLFIPRETNECFAILYLLPKNSTSCPGLLG